jgi:hypothetical protein
MSSNKLEKLLHLVGWFIWIVWWCTDQQTLNFKWTDIVLVFIDRFSFGRFFLFKIANNVSYLSSATNESISFIHTLSFSFPVFWQVLIQCSVTSFWANNHMWFKQNQRLLLQLLSSWWWAWGLPKHKRQVINLRNFCILLVELFELYDDARTSKL